MFSFFQWNFRLCLKLICSVHTCSRYAQNEWNLNKTWRHYFAPPRFWTDRNVAFWFIKYSQLLNIWECRDAALLYFLCIVAYGNDELISVEHRICDYFKWCPYRNRIGAGETSRLWNVIFRVFPVFFLFLATPGSLAPERCADNDGVFLDHGVCRCLPEIIIKPFFQVSSSYQGKSRWFLRGEKMKCEIFCRGVCLKYPYRGSRSS